MCRSSPPAGKETEENEDEKEPGGKREKPVVRPEEIPPVPENRFLLRRDVMPAQDVKAEVSIIKDTNTYCTHQTVYTLITMISWCNIT